ncbi:MAG: sugar transferase [Gemmatimonadota bacterium]|jgi:lipopolysaccharide/colanic/teichoic acid biosynthesis glycosyltransferase|nr:sugar transferase [Gemmatimonadota bacterium]
MEMTWEGGTAVDRTLPRQRSEWAERALNATLAVLLLVLVSPLMLVVAVLVWINSPGSVIYTQTRVGVDRRWRRGNEHDDRRSRDIGGAPFTIYKFRTMYVDAEAGTGEVWATQTDPRITPFGRHLRRLRLDELPQLVNVLRGEMNLVGPRPERPGIFAELRRDIAEYPKRQRAKPGITGLAQITCSYDSCLEDVARKVALDLEYLTRRGVREDLRILFRTVPVVLFRRGGW